MVQLYLHVYGWLYFRGLMGQLYLHGPADWFYFRGGWYSYMCMPRGDNILEVSWDSYICMSMDGYILEVSWYSYICMSMDGYILEV